VHKWRPDVIFSGVAYPTAILAAWVAACYRLPLVVYAHSEDVTIAGRWKRLSLRLALGRAVSVVAPSRFTRQELVALGVPPARLRVIHPGVEILPVDPSGCPAWLEPLRRKWLVLTVARLVLRKGQDMVLRALPRLVEQLPDTHYLVVGSGPDLGRLKALAEELGIAGYVTFAGQVSDVDLGACYHACQVFVMPTRRDVEQGATGPYQFVQQEDALHRKLVRSEVEGFGIAYLEAAAAGKPAIGSRSGGASEAVLDGETGLLVDALDVDALAASILRLALDPEYAHSLGAAGQARVAHGLRAEDFANQLTDLLREATK